MDTISDMLTRIRNAQAVGKTSLLMPHSKLKLEIARILKSKGFIDDYKKESEGAVASIRIILKYEKTGTNKRLPAITSIAKVSKLGKRVYVGKNDIRKVRNGYGISILSTSRGVMTGDDAKRLGVGGEVICEVW